MSDSDTDKLLAIMRDRLVENGFLFMNILTQLRVFLPYENVGQIKFYPMEDGVNWRIDIYMKYTMNNPHTNNPHTLHGKLDELQEYLANYNEWLIRRNAK